MRHWMVTLGLALTLASPAWAGKDEKEKEEPQIEMTGLASMDDTFGRAKAIDDRLNAAKVLLRDAKVELNTALGLEKGTPIKDGLDDLKAKGEGKMKVAMNGNKPKLEATDAVPANVQAAIDAVNHLVDDISASTTELAGVPEESQALATEAAAAPAKVKDEMTAAGMKMTEMPKTVKIVKTNAEITAGLPAKAKDVTERMADLLARVAELAPKKDGAEAPPAEE